MKRRPYFIQFIAVAIAFCAGCVDMDVMFQGSPTTRSFSDPEARVTIELQPKDALFGDWTANGKTDRFVEKFRVTTFASKVSFSLLEDGTCTYLSTVSVSETYGPTYIRQYVKYPAGARCELEFKGTWTYEGDELRLDLYFVKKDEYLTRYSGGKTGSLVFTVKWHSPSEFSLDETEAQHALNSMFFIDSPFCYAAERRTWDSRIISPGGVVTKFKKGDSMHLDETSYDYMSTFRRTTP